MDKAQLKQKILNVIKGMSENECFAIYRNGCDYFDCLDNEIFPMDDFDEIDGNQRPFSEVYEDLADDFSFNDNYYYQEGYAHYHSLSNLKGNELFWYTIDDFVDSAIYDEFDFGSPKIAKVFEEARSEEK